MLAFPFPWDDTQSHAEAAECLCRSYRLPDRQENFGTRSARPWSTSTG